jgi:hypothetical protein
MKKTDLFDKVLREKLEGLNPSNELSHWELLEKRLEEGALEEEVGYSVGDRKPIDEAVFEKLHPYQAPYKASHWDKMAATLDEVFAWPVQVLRYKAAELLLMLLAFVFIWQSASDNLAPYATPSTATIASKTNTGKKNSSTTDQAAVFAPGDVQAEENTTETQPSATAEEEASNSTAQSKQGQPATDQTNHFTTASDTEKEPSHNQQSPSAVSSTRKAAPIALLNRGLSSKRLPPVLHPLPANTYVAPLDNELSLLHKRSSILHLDKLPNEVNAGLAYEPTPDLSDVTEVRALKRRNVLRLGMYASAEYNHIEVQPGLEKSDEEVLDRFAMGYGSGLTIGLDMGRWELETGAAYASRMYPVGLVYVQGSLREGYIGSKLRAGELNIISVPLHARYNFIHKREWRAYVISGAALQIAFQANYYAVESPEHSFLPNPAGPPPQQAPGGTGESSITRIKKESIGLLEGGAFNDNAYLTGNLGFGVERYINDRWSLFLQPTYQYSLHYFREGLGPNRDQINSLSFLFGTKVRMW